jgi:ribosome-binding factor A
MSRRIERINNLIRNTLGELLLTKLSDPRIDPARVSVTRVETADDLLSAKVYVSVMGSETEQRNTLRALQHASGRLQDLLRRQIQLRNTPLLRFIADERFKKTIQTLRLINQAMEEIREKEALQEGQDDQSTDEGQVSTDQSPGEDDQPEQQEKGDEEA